MLGTGSFSWVVFELDGEQERWTWMTEGAGEREEGEEREVKLDDFFAIHEFWVEQEQSKQRFPSVKAFIPVTIFLAVPYPPPEG